MAQPQMALVMCYKCNACYSSERELLNHKIAFHREFGSEQASSQPGATQSDSVTIQPCEQQKMPNREGGSGHGG